MFKRISDHLSDALGFLKLGWRKLFVAALIFLAFFWIGSGPIFLIECYVAASIIVTLIDKTLAYTSPTREVPEWYELDSRILVISILLSSPLIFLYLSLILPFFGISIIPELLQPIWRTLAIIYYPLLMIFTGPTAGFILIGMSTISLSIIVGLVPSALIVYFFDRIIKRRFPRPLSKVTLFAVLSLIIVAIIFYFFNIGLKSSMVYDCSLVNQFFPEDPYKRCPSGVHINDDVSIENCNWLYEGLYRNVEVDEKLFSFFKEDYLALVSRNKLDILYSDCAGVVNACEQNDICIFGNENLIHIAHFRIRGCTLNHIFLLPKFPKYQSLESVIKSEYYSLIENNKLSTKILCTEAVPCDGGRVGIEKRYVTIFTTDDNIILKENHITCP